jgi:hypothetical protein
VLPVAGASIVSAPRSGDLAAAPQSSMQAMVLARTAIDRPCAISADHALTLQSMGSTGFELRSG